MDNDPIQMKLKKKYLIGRKARRNGAYRTRTGPHCCNAGCGSGKKKSRRTVTIRKAA